MGQNKEVCKGCRSYYGLFVTDDNKEIPQRSCMVNRAVLSDTDQCPCITCIIKGMCRRPCKEFENFIHWSNYDWK